MYVRQRVLMWPNDSSQRAVPLATSHYPDMNAIYNLPPKARSHLVGVMDFHQGQPMDSEQFVP